MNDNFVRAVLEVQQKTGMKNALLQKRVQTLAEVTEHKDLKIAELLAATEAPSTAASKKLQVGNSPIP